VRFVLDQVEELLALMPTILVIEDDEDIRKLITFILVKEGFEVHQAINGLIGVQMAFEKQPDLILSDIMMPDMDGYQTLAALRQDERTNAIPFIFLTSKGERQDFRRGMTIGADDYVVKPFTKNELVEAINARLSRQAATITKYKDKLQKLEEKYNQLVTRDTLTGLPNLLTFRKTLQQAQAQAEANEFLRYAVLLVGFGRFEQISQAIGITASNELLKNIASQLSNYLTTKINWQEEIASLGNGQFAILLPSVSQEDQVEYFAHSIIREFTRSIRVSGQELFMKPFIGAALSNREQKKAEVILKQAEVALAQGKNTGTLNYYLYKSGLGSSASNLDKLNLEGNLSQAVERNEFELFYQPQIELKTRQIVGVEALLRWRNPNRGIVLPTDFIPLAEETGLIHGIGEWVLRSACAQIKEWQNDGFDSLRMAVNISNHQFTHTDIGKTIEGILAEADLESRFLELELTESAVAQDIQKTVTTLYELKRIGVSVAIDDFGTGYSSLSYLMDIPASNLKIDKSFIRNITTDANYAFITRSIIDMAHKLDLKVIAEGVETPQELNFLEQNYCDEIQGYLFSRPVPAPEIGKLLKTGKKGLK
jgi:diguanylate cyclase (GGDEF)-like protein